VPRVQGGLGVDYAVTDKAAVALALSMGRADGRLSWAADGSLAGFWMLPEGPGVRLDLGMRTRRSEYDVVYEESDSSATIPGSLSASRSHWDAFATFTVNSPPTPTHAFDWHVVLEAGLVTYLDHPLVGEFALYDLERRGSLFALNVGVSRPLRSRRFLWGLRYASIDGDDAVVQLYTQVDLLFKTDRKVTSEK
jgi:hypothetical protein